LDSVSSEASATGCSSVAAHAEKVAAKQCRTFSVMSQASDQLLPMPKKLLPNSAVHSGVTGAHQLLPMPIKLLLHNAERPPAVS